MPDRSTMIRTDLLKTSANAISLPVLTLPQVIRPAAHKSIWLRRIGWAGFLFFLIKGLVWLAAPLLLAGKILDR